MIGAAVLVLGGGALTAAADAEATTATITGSITREAGGAPVEGVGVFISPTAGGFSFNGSSDATGGYTVTDLPAGEYIVRFAPDGAAPDLLTEYWDGASDREAAQRLTVVAGETLTGIDASLQVAGSITGTVTRDGDETPVAGATVAVSPVDGSWVPELAWTQEDGSFLVGGLPSGQYTVRFEGPADSGLTGEFWDDAVDSASATPVTVVAGESAPGIDAGLAQAAVISGQVTREFDGSPVAGVVDIWPLGQMGGQSVTIEADGSYRAEVAPGSYTLRFRPTDSRLFTEFWDDASTVQEATAITVASGEQRQAVDAELAAGTAITGIVRSDGEALAGISVMAFVGDLPVGSATSAEDGSYSLTLPAGDYVLRAQASVFEPVYASEYYENAVTADDATVLTLGDDEDLSGIDIAMDLGVDIRGSVTLEGAGAPGGEGATVVAYRWDGERWVEALRVPSWGTFAFSPDPSQDGGVLPAGRYTVGVEMPGYCSQYFGGALSLEDAESFELAPGDTATGADLSLTVECDAPASKPRLTLAADSVRAGGQLALSGTGFVPGEEVSFELHSDPLALGTLTADAGGALKGTLRIPAGASVGAHTLVAMNAQSVVVASASLRVTAASGTGGALASTGADAPVAAAAVAFAAVVLGLLLVRRRRVES